MTDYEPYFNRREAKSKRQTLGKNMPPAEVVLWANLKGRQLRGYKFRRQYSVGDYILDFYCPQWKIGIEIDGDSHFREGARQCDETRQAFIESFGIRVLRFLNTDVYDNVEGLLEVLVREMGGRERKNPPP